MQIVYDEKYPLMLHYVACNNPQYTTVVKLFKYDKSKSSKGLAKPFTLEHDLPTKGGIHDERFNIVNEKIDKLQRACSKKFKKILDENKDLKSELAEIKILLLGKVKGDGDLKGKSPSNYDYFSPSTCPPFNNVPSSENIPAKEDDTVPSAEGHDAMIHDESDDLDKQKEHEESISLTYLLDLLFFEVEVRKIVLRIEIVFAHAFVVVVYFCCTSSKYKKN